MTARLVAIWRHPIKAHGREALERVQLARGQTLPWDRTWAVAHEAARLKGRDWVPCANFTRGAKVPALMAITAALDEARAEVTLRHPDLSPLTFAPDTEAERFLDWIAPLMPADRAAPVSILRAAGAGFTLTPESEDALTAWMRAHLTLRAWATQDASLLADVADQVNADLAPALALDGVAAPSAHLCARLAAMAAAVTFGSA